MNRLDLTRPLQQRCGRRAWVMTPPKGADMLVGYIEDSEGVVLRTNWNFNGSWFGAKPTAHDLVYADEPTTVTPKVGPIADLTRRVEALEAKVQPAKTASFVADGATVLADGKVEAHIAEQGNEVDDAVRRLGQRVIDEAARMQPAKTAIDRLWEWQRQSPGARVAEVGLFRFHKPNFVAAAWEDEWYKATGPTPEAAAEALLAKLEVERE